MARLIDKDALVAEIERLYDEKGAFYAADVLYNLEEWLDTLEAKEVDLSKEIDNYFDNYKFAEKEECWLNHDQAHIFAKHFFELGLLVSNKTQKGE